MKSQLEQHLKTGMHQKNLARFQARPSRQLLINEAVTAPNPFFQDLCETFLAADIPWTKLNHPKMRDFFEKYTERTIPDESTLRKNYLPRVFKKVNHLQNYNIILSELIREEVINRFLMQTIEQIRDDIGNQPVWLQVDETKDPTGRCIVNVIVGALSVDNPQCSHLLFSKEIPGDSQNSHSITRLVLDSFRKRQI